MGHEDFILGNIDRRRERRQELSPSMNAAYRKALLTLRHPDYAIQEEDFMSVYPESEVRADMQNATRLRSQFDLDLERNPYDKVSKQFADVLEAVVLEETELSNWLGENAHTFKSSDHDDFNNKVDMIAEWVVPGEGSQVVGLAVDVTYGGGSVFKKLEQIKAEIDGGKLRSVKYFRDTEGNMRPQHNVPRVVLGVSQEVVEKLAHLWVHGKKAELGNHPIQRVFLIEMETQLRVAAAYAREQGNETAAAAYENAHAIVAPILREKSSVPFGDIGNDTVALDIVRSAKRIFAVKGDEKKEAA